jgi:hypothetical protein
MKISEWPNAPQWLRDARTENADVEISESGYVTWRGGTWHGGYWHGGYWRGGDWLGGTWWGGDWRGGTWHGGDWLGGDWRGGTWWGGDWLGGNWLGGTWLGGYWRGGDWLGGDWLGGDWRGGKVNEIEGAKVIITFAHCDGWPKTLVDVNGEAWILAGCRWFNFADARKHWAGREDRIMTRALLHGAYHLAKHMGLKCE